MEAQAQADKLVFVQRFREQQVVVDVDNALSAMERAKERMEAAAQSLRLAKTLEEGERFRFGLGATSVLFVNLRERNTVDSEFNSSGPRRTIRKRRHSINGRSGHGQRAAPWPCLCYRPRLSGKTW